MSDDPNDKPLGRDLDLEAWDAEAPPADFAERVVARIHQESRASGESYQRSHQSNQRLHSSDQRSHRARARPWGIAGGAVGALALAAAVAVKIVPAGAAAHGEVVAEARTEVAIGSRALAVLEPGASVKWDGDDVVQPQGDVFYRVEKGSRFRVHTPAGDVEVKGTCFTVKVHGDDSMQKRDMKSGAVGAALTALAFVAVYEGKVAVSHAGERVDLAAGETAQAGADGLRKSGDLGEGQRAFDAKLAEHAANDPLASANENLVSQVADYKKRLETLAAQKSEIEKKLDTTEKQLEAAREGGAAPKAKHDFDLGPDDWKELAKDGTIKARIPCQRAPNWQPSADWLQNLGLAPQDAAAVKNAYTRSNQRLWSAVKPLCAQELGSAEAAEKIGPSTCQHLVLDMEAAKDGDDRDAVGDAMRLVGEIRAGLRPMPGPNEPLHPVAKMFLAATAETKLFEADLAQAFGPEEAHRLTFANGMCMGHSTWGGHGPRTPKP